VPLENPRKMKQREKQNRLDQCYQNWTGHYQSVVLNEVVSGYKYLLFLLFISSKIIFELQNERVQIPFTSYL
jgi:hypothetical protein